MCLLPALEGQVRIGRVDPGIVKALAVADKVDHLGVRDWHQAELWLVLCRSLVKAVRRRGS